MYQVSQDHLLTIPAPNPPSPTDKPDESPPAQNNPSPPLASPPPLNDDTLDAEPNSVGPPPPNDGTLDAELNSLRPPSRSVDSGRSTSNFSRSTSNLSSLDKPSPLTHNEEGRPLSFSVSNPMAKMANAKGVSFLEGGKVGAFKSPALEVIATFRMQRMGRDRAVASALRLPRRESRAQRATTILNPPSLGLGGGFFRLLTC